MLGSEAFLKSFNARVTAVSFSGGFGITLLRPAHPSLWWQWMMGKRVPEITPPNLRNRSWADFPHTEVGLARGGHAPHSDRTLTSSSCPEVLEMRELREHRPLGSVDRDALDARLMVTPRPGSGLGPPRPSSSLRHSNVLLSAGIPRGSDEPDAAVRGDGGERASLRAGDPRRFPVFYSRRTCVGQDAVR